MVLANEEIEAWVIAQAGGGLVERLALARKFSWAIPNVDALQALHNCGPLLEIGAGTGYWAYLLRKLGTDIVAVDQCPYHNDYAKAYWSTVLRGNQWTARRYPERTLFLCWPPYGEPMASTAVRSHKRAGGRRVAYIGESIYGCTADTAFFDLMRKYYTQVQCVDIPQWNAKDSLVIYERRS